MLIFMQHLCLISGAQNLVSNPSFENINYCPPTNSQYPQDFNNCIIDWINPIQTTPDVFNACNNPPSGGGDVGVPSNAYGFMSPHTSGNNAYVGILTYASDFPNWKEYIQTQIQLQGGIIYNVQFYVTLASLSGWYTENLGAYISTTQFSSSIQNSNNPIILTPTYQDNNYIGTGSWVQISFQYTAPSTGTYYFTIGDFSSNNHPQRTSVEDNGYAYYYLDDISISEAPGCCPDNLTIDNVVYSSNATIGANNSITAGPNVTVDNGTNVTYIAGNYIDLLPGFDEQPGAIFDATIGACPAQDQNISIGTFTDLITNCGNDGVCGNIYGGTSYSVNIYGFEGLIYTANNISIAGMPVCIWYGLSSGYAPVSAGSYEAVLTITGCGNDKQFTLPVTVSDCPSSRTANQDSLANKNNHVNKIDSISNKNASINSTQLQSDNSNVANQNLLVYPNPSEGIITASIPHLSNSPSAIQIFDNLGNLIYILNNTDISNLNIDMHNQSKGIYFLRVINGDKVLLTKFAIM